MIVLFWSTICLLLFAPGLRRAPRTVLLAALLYGLNDLLVVGPLWWSNQAALGLQYNWLGKLLAAAFSLLLIYGLRWVSPQESGLQQPAPGSWRMVGLVALATAALQLVSGYLVRHQVPRPSMEALAYQLTMPGLAEELFSRGVLLGLLNRVFPRTIPFFGTRTSWGGLAGIVLFILDHGFNFTHPLMLMPAAHLPLGRIADKLVFGMLFLWVRERSGSVWAAVATHNLSNIALVLGQLVP